MMMQCTYCALNGCQPDCFSPNGDTECSGFIDPSLVPSQEDQEEPEQYIIK